MPYPEKFTGFQVNGPETWHEFHKNEFDPKPFGDYDVDVEIECCGVCGSDLHTVSGGWGEQHFPLAVGHGENFLSLASRCYHGADLSCAIRDRWQSDQGRA